jgi:hypothetical protein
MHSRSTKFVPDRGRPILEAINQSQIERAVSGEFSIDVRGLRLAAGRFPIELSPWSLLQGKRALAAILPGSADAARIEIGEVQIEEMQATLVLFGPPDFDVQELVF